MSRFLLRRPLVLVPVLLAVSVHAFVHAKKDPPESAAICEQKADPARKKCTTELKKSEAACEKHAALQVDKCMSGLPQNKGMQAKHALEDDYPDLTGRKSVLEQGRLAKDYKVCFVGDTGNESEEQEKVARQLAAEGRCNEVRHLGDIVYYMGVDKLSDKLFADRFKKAYANLPMKMSFVLGNHDYYKSPDAWLGVSEQGAKAPAAGPKFEFPNPYYLEIFAPPGSKGLCFLSLDTTPFNTPPAGGKPVDYASVPRVKRQITWLKDQVKTIQSRCSQVFSLAHHPYSNVSNERDDTLTRFLVEELYQKILFDQSKGNVRMVIAGHDHFLAYFSKLPKRHSATTSKDGTEVKPSCTDVRKPEDYYEVAQVISGSGGMLNDKTPMFLGKNLKTDTYAACKRAEAFRKAGFVQMKLNTASDDEKNFSVDFTYFDLDGKELGKFTWPQAVSQETSTAHRCGAEYKDAKCDAQRCCSQFNWCGDLNETDKNQKTYCAPVRESKYTQFDGPRLGSASGAK